MSSKPILVQTGFLNNRRNLQTQIIDGTAREETT